MVNAVDLRQAAKQADRVGMTRSMKELFNRRGLDNPAAVHHRHPIGHLGDHAEVMSDEDDGRPGLGLALGAGRPEPVPER